MALALGRTVGELERTMSVREFADWRRFIIDHPLPAELADINAARLLALLANINKSRNSPVVDWRELTLLGRRTRAMAKPVLTIAQQMKAAAETR